MANPYTTKGAAQFWRTAIADVAPEDVSPIPNKKFIMNANDRVATAGSCFAQHVSRYIERMPDVQFLQTEDGFSDQPVFSALYGNIYTAAQLWQLYSETNNRVNLPPLAWQRPDGRWVDGYRPTIFAKGFADREAVAGARRQHLDAVRRLFSECTVFVFTLGLTEGWAAGDGNIALPIHPGLVTDDPIASNVNFRRYKYEEIKADLENFLTEIKRVNPSVRVILTVSPVPLTATFTDEHVLTATVFSKSVLRAVCGAMEEAFDYAYYFPSFEIISSHYNNGSYYESNKRAVTESGVAHVMRIFRQTYFDPDTKTTTDSHAVGSNSMLAQSYSAGVVCDEEKYGTNIGF